MTPLWIIGSGGHARVVIDIARTTGLYELIGCLDDDPSRRGDTVSGVPIVGSSSREIIHERGIQHALIAVGSNRARNAISVRLENAVTWVSLVHSHAYVAPSATIGAGTIVGAGAVIQPGAVVGDHVIVNTASSVDHDCRIADLAHIAPGAHLAGSVSVGKGTLLGVGSSVIPGRSIGEWVTVGAGAVVVDNVEDEATVVGVPAHRVSGRKSA
jgi:sugar O-acyltransferase (sialic acid O-acetyltransferase NeuD family)